MSQLLFLERLQLLAAFLLSCHGQFPDQGPFPQNLVVQATGPVQGTPGSFFPGTRQNSMYSVNMVPFGAEAGDQKVNPGMLTAGLTIDLHMFFPFYGGLYNYTTISINGYMAFATVLDQGPTINIGPEMTDWPKQEDPAMIAPYLCKQQAPHTTNINAGVYYRLLLRQSLFERENKFSFTQTNSSNDKEYPQACPGTPDSYVRCDQNSDNFLEEMMRWLQEGVAGGSMFRAEAALVVTWYKTASAISGRSDIDSGQTASYQAIWLTDQAARLSYVILNYDRLGFDAQDFRANSRSGRCRALFNGGNHTGLVEVDPTQPYKNTPKVLARRSGVPHMVRGRYMFRVDDIVRPAGCSNKTGGKYPMMIHPNIVNMLGETTVDVNALCLQKTQTYILMNEEREEVAACVVINSAIARCELPKIYDWGTKTVYFQPHSRGTNDQKAFIGYIYFVPPTLDPMRLDIGNIYDWYKNPMISMLMPFSWYPRNFTNPDYDMSRLSDDALYDVQLGLFVVGYREYKDDEIKKFTPEHRTLARLATYSNRNSYEYRFRPQEEVVNLNQVQQWYLTELERRKHLYFYRVGYLKLAPLHANDMNGTNLLPGLVTLPVSLHWLWAPEDSRFPQTTFSSQPTEERVEFVKKKSLEMCHDWYNEDGALLNFIRDTETNTSCPCVESQARLDLGRFMPHPRCSQIFRDISCTTMIGSKNCYMSAQNIYASYSGAGTTFDNMDTQRFMTHYGQVCCYDEQGFLLQSPYQPVIKTQQDYFYNPGYPLRAYEFGTPPYMGQFEVPGLSVFHHDYMPYFLCCKFADFRCQMFYWRRPSSACQEYKPPASGRISGPGVINTIDNDKFIFNEPGIFNFLYIPSSNRNPEVRAQIRLERYPNRRVDFGLLGRYISQPELVQPTNVTVVTGIAIEGTGTDRVHVVVRKDTRRFRYRTEILVGGIIRYFDTVHLQKFGGVLIYVNNVQRGQPEVYVVLEEAQVGFHISESYALDIDRLPQYRESMGLLEVTVSLPPFYEVQSDGDQTLERQQYDFPQVFGLIRPFPGRTSEILNRLLTLNDINADIYRQQIIANYRLPGTGEPGSDKNMAGTLIEGIPINNMYTTSRDDEKQFDVFPEAQCRSSPVYKTAAQWRIGANQFVAQTGRMLQQLILNCREIEDNYTLNTQSFHSVETDRYVIQNCPDSIREVITECRDNVPCIFDYTLLNSKVMATEEHHAWNTFLADRATSTRQYNSCGAINIEYPEYMMKTPALASGYLQGDVARFDCYHSHWIKGDNEYKCGLVVDYNDPDTYRYEWNKGNQPWCRSKVKENYFKWITTIFGFFGIIMAIVFVFFLFWCCKQRRIRSDKSSRNLVFCQLSTAEIPRELNKSSKLSASAELSYTKPGEDQRGSDSPTGKISNFSEADPHSDRPEGREQWGSQLQFILVCIGYVVGLGNIWRFPSLAYEYGGGAFLIPYIVCSLLFGVPVVLLEQAMGQFTRAGPSVGFAYYAPLCQGVGWAMAFVGATVAMYYTVVIAWSIIYLYKIVTGAAWEWSSCKNQWNTLCQSTTSLALVPSSRNYVILRSEHIADFRGINWKVLLALFLVWATVASVMSRGVEFIGRLSYFTATVPYMIIAAFFVRGITLDGAREGLDFYILQPDFSYISNLETWQAALTQCCFSLSIGFGGIMAMSSYNDFKHNCFRDVLILVAADNFMNLFGGIAVFSILGFLAKQLGKPLSQVIQSGTSLAFVVYPEAISRMPLPSLWAFMFFFMMVVLGITSTFGYVQVMTTCLRDEFSSLYPRRTFITFISATIFFAGGIVICTEAGLYWFVIFNDFTGSTCICAIALVELILLTYCYGLKEMVIDFRLMFGFPSSWFGRWFGATGRFMQLAWLFVAPLMAATVLVSTFIRKPLTYGKGNRVYQFPWWASLMGWMLVLIPLACIPAFAIANAIRFKRDGKDLVELYRIQPGLRSYNRIHGIQEKQKIYSLSSSMGRGIPQFDKDCLKAKRFLRATS